MYSQVVNALTPTQIVKFGLHDMFAVAIFKSVSSFRLHEKVTHGHFTLVMTILSIKPDFSKSTRLLRV